MHAAQSLVDEITQLQCPTARNIPTARALDWSRNLVARLTNTWQRGCCDDLNGWQCSCLLRVSVHTECSGERDGRKWFDD
jgi:hypothetical protein